MTTPDLRMRINLDTVCACAATV